LTKKKDNADKKKICTYDDRGVKVGDEDPAEEARFSSIEGESTDFGSPKRNFATQAGKGKGRKYKKNGVSGGENASLLRKRRSKSRQPSRRRQGKGRQPSSKKIQFSTGREEFETKRGRGILPVLRGIKEKVIRGKRCQSTEILRHNRRKRGSLQTSAERRKGKPVPLLL